MKKIILAVSLAALSPWAAMASNVSAGDPEVLAEIMRGYGSATISTDSSGDPKIEGRIDGTRYNVLFYGCKQNTNCGSVQFTTAWSHPGISLDTINDWNRDKRFGKAYLDSDGDPALEMNVNLRHGVSRKNFDDTVDFWRLVLKTFKEEVLGQ